ncbi:MAG: hypothetical protein ACPGPD_13375, partial [Pseudomonadales bacterium]
MSLGTHPLGTVPLGAAGPVSQIEKALEIETKIPLEARIEVQEFIRDSYKDLWEEIPDLLEVTPPPEIAEWWDVVLEII